MCASYVSPNKSKSKLSKKKNNTKTTKSKKTSALNLVLDLDETLIHSVVVPCTPGFNPKTLSKIEYKHPKIQNNQYVLTAFQIDDNSFYLVYYRPFLRHFIQSAMSLGYHLHVFTYGTDEYCKCIVSAIIKFLEHNPFKIICARSHTRPYGAKTLKIMDLDPENTVIIDDNVDVWKWDSNNVIKIKPYDNINDVKKSENLQTVLDKLAILSKLAKGKGLI